MYNRYVPTADGTYRRQIVSTTAQQPCPKDAPAPTAETAPQPPQRTSVQLPGITPGLPTRPETGDLLVLLILLLVLLEGQETDTLTVLVTLAAFLLLQ